MSAGVNPDTGKAQWHWFKKEKDADGNDIKDENGNPVGEWTITDVYQNVSSDNDSWKLLMCSMPKVFGGFGTSLFAYGFDFSIAFDYQLGGTMYDGSYAGYLSAPTANTVGKNLHLDVYDAWTPENRDSQQPRFQYDDQYMNSTSDRFLISSNYLNISNISLGYSFPAKWWNGHIQNLRVYAACDNVWYWSKRKGMDPRGTGTGQYSPIRTISGGVTLTF
jgi:hypothetical protein